MNAPKHLFISIARPSSNLSMQMSSSYQFVHFFDQPKWAISSSSLSSSQGSLLPKRSFSLQLCRSYSLRLKSRFGLWLESLWPSVWTHGLLLGEKYSWCRVWSTLTSPHRFFFNLQSISSILRVEFHFKQRMFCNDYKTKCYISVFHAYLITKIHNIRLF